MEEIWKKIKGHETYEISNLGRVRSLGRTTKTITGKDRFIKPRMLKPTLTKVGSKSYYMVHLLDGKKSKIKYIHRLILEAFVDVPDKYKDVKPFNLVCDHIDNDPTNNSIENLQWLTRSENAIKDAFNKGIKIRIIELDKVFSSQSKLIKYLREEGLCYNSDLGGAISNIKRSIEKGIKMYGYTYEFIEGND
jgi:hypothetical protein